MSDQKRTRTGTRRTTMAVLEILKSSTSAGSPVSVVQLVKRLKAEYAIDTSRDSVKAILDDLQEYYPGPDRIQCRRSGKARSYQFDYYYQTHLPETLQENIQKIEEAIRRNKNRHTMEWRISFHFNGYGSDKQLHPTGSPIENVLPVRLLWAYGHPYLVGFFAGQQDAAHFRVDLMDLIRMVEAPRTEDCQRDFRINQIMEEDYQAAHLYMFYEGPKERPRQIRLRVKKIPGKPDASMTFLQDHFGTHWRPVVSSETDTALEIWVKCLPSAMALFVRQYMDRVRVLEPEEVAKKVEDTLRRDFQTYFLENF
ncbi:MAG: WYL domain-containing protein [Lachnospiraceae bacterium]|nr:WYL domain-containing protein [Lachnospiraceae bacterium]